MIAFIQSILRVILKTALAAVVPFIPGLVNDPAGTWQIAALTVGLAVVIAIATALISLPDVNEHGWAAAAFMKSLRQFGQMVIAATASAVLLTDVDWRAVLLAAGGSALSTLVIAAVEGIPGTPAEVPLPPLDLDNPPAGDGTWNEAELGGDPTPAYELPETD